MRTKIENNTLTVCLEGRIDSNNAASVEAELFEAVNANPNAAVTVDADALEYISSAGLRVLMKLRKQVGKALPVLNVSPEVYDIFETTGFTELLDVKKRLREISVEGCELDDEPGITVTAFQAESCSMGIILDNCLLCQQTWRLIIASTL